MEQPLFRSLLHKEYLKRRDHNPSYSLRAFARQLNVDAGSLSQYLKGSRQYSHKKLKALSAVLGLDSQEASKLIVNETSKTPNLKYIELDRLHLLSKWYYAAILESLSLDNFEPSPQWIAEKLGLPVPVVNAALNQLFSAGVLSLMPNGQWQNHWETFSTQKNETIDEAALRSHQKQLLQLAAESIDKNSAEDKSHTAYVTTIDQDLIPEIQIEIRNFRRKMAQLIKKKSKKNDSIYCLQINLFPESVLLKSKGASDEKK